MKQFRNMAYPYIVWSVIMIIVPMLMIVMYAFTQKGNDVLTFRVTLDNFIYFFSDSIFLEVLERSLWVAVLTTVLCLFLGYPVAYIISQASGRKKMMLVLLVTGVLSVPLSFLTNLLLKLVSLITLPVDLLLGVLF